MIKVAVKIQGRQTHQDQQPKCLFILQNLEDLNWSTKILSKAKNVDKP